MEKAFNKFLEHYLPVALIVGFLIGVFIVKNDLLFWLRKLADYSFFKLVYWTVAIFWSTFLARYAFKIHTKIDYENIHLQTRIQQFILNLLGAIIGWILIAIFIWTSWFSNLPIGGKIAFGVIIFLSITGYIPYKLIVKNEITHDTNV